VTPLLWACGKAKLMARRFRSKTTYFKARKQTERNWDPTIHFEGMTSMT
jgi:hypothetical protein